MILWKYVLMLPSPSTMLSHTVLNQSNIKYADSSSNPLLAFQESAILDIFTSLQNNILLSVLIYLVFYNLPLYIYCHSTLIYKCKIIQWKFNTCHLWAIAANITIVIKHSHKFFHQNHWWNSKWSNMMAMFVFYISFCMIC